MNEAAKKRLIGAVVLVLLMVIFVPMLFEEQPAQNEPEPRLGQDVPARPVIESVPPTETFQPLGARGAGNQSLGEDEMMPFDKLAPEVVSRSVVKSSPPDASPPPAVVPPPSASRPTQVPPAPGALTTPAPRPPTASGKSGNFVVQVASLNTQERAAEMEQALRQKGFKAFTEKAEVNGRVYYRVRVGPKSDRAQAGQLAESVKQAGYRDALVLAQP